MRVPLWSCNFLITKGELATYMILLDKFVASRWGRVAAEATLYIGQVTGIGFSLSLISADDTPNPDFDPRPFRLVVYDVQFAQVCHPLL